MNAPPFFNINDPANLSSSSSSSITPQTPTSPSQQQQPTPGAPNHHHHHHLHNLLHQQHHGNAASRHGAVGSATASQGPTRFQFIVPGEQVDLYG